jgi:hypothetical protein
MKWHSSLVALPIFAVVLLSAGWSSFARSTDSNSQSGLSLVKLIASIQGVQYCAGDNDVYTVHLQLGLRYSNLGDGRIILFKPKARIEILRAEIAESRDALREQRYDAVIQYDQFVQPERLPNAEAPDPMRFAIVDPGHSYELTGAVNIPARFKISPSISGTVAPGTHVLSVEVTNWPFSPESGKRLRQKWSGYGLLEYGAINAEPLEFHVSGTPKVQNCSR